MYHMIYIVVEVCPVWIYSSSTGRAPIHVRRITVFTYKKKIVLSKWYAVLLGMVQYTPKNVGEVW